MYYGDEEFRINLLIGLTLDTLTQRGIENSTLGQIESAVDEVLLPTFRANERRNRNQIILGTIQRLKTLREETTMIYGNEEFTINSLIDETLDVLRRRMIETPTMGQIESAVDELLTPAFMNHFKKNRNQIVIGTIQRFEKINTHNVNLSDNKVNTYTLTQSAIDYFEVYIDPSKKLSGLTFNDIVKFVEYAKDMTIYHNHPTKTPNIDVAKSSLYFIDTDDSCVRIAIIDKP